MTKSPPQHKQRYYYIFWSIATLLVVLGQIYVASSYRLLAEALKLSLTWINTNLNLLNLTLKRKTAALDLKLRKFLKNIIKSVEKWQKS